MEANENSKTNELTSLLQSFDKGDREAMENLLPHVYKELKQIASSYMRKEREDHTLQPTALVHEAYLKLLGQRQVQWQNRAHFYGIAAQLMRRILIDHARNKRASKRGGSHVKLSFDEKIHSAENTEMDVLALDHALTKLAALDARQAQVVELRYFGGLSIEEAAAALKTSTATVKRDWTVAKAWLHRELSKENSN